MLNVLYQILNLLYSSGFSLLAERRYIEDITNVSVKGCYCITFYQNSLWECRFIVVSDAQLEGKMQCLLM